MLSKLNLIVFIASLTITFIAGGCDSLEEAAQAASTNLGELEQAIRATEAKQGGNTQAPKSPGLEPPPTFKSGATAKTAPNTATLSGTFNYEVIGSTNGITELNNSSGKINGIQYLISKDSHSFARTERVGSRMRMVLNGTPGPDFNKIENVVFSPDGKRLGYVGTTSDKIRVIVDGQVVYSASKSETSIVRLPDGRHFINSKYPFTGQIQTKPRGQSILFSADSKHYAFIAGLSSNQRILEMTAYVDGDAVETAKYIGLLKFTPTNRILLSTANRYRGSGHYTIDGAKGPDASDKNTSLGPIRFSGDDQRFFYQCNGLPYLNHALAFDRDKPIYKDKIDDFEFIVSDNLKHSALIISKHDPVGRATSRDLYINDGLIDSLRVPQYGLNINPDYKDSGKVFLGPNGDLIYQRNDSRVVLNGEAHRDYASLNEVIFSPDGNRLYYIVNAENSTTWLVDKDQAETGPLFLKSIMAFSPNSKYFAILNNRILRLEGEVILDKLNKKSTFWFSKDSKKLFVTLLRDDDSPSARDSKAKAKAIGLDLVFASAPQMSSNGILHMVATSNDGRYKAKNIHKYFGGDRGHEYWIEINGQRVGETFKQWPLAMRFDDQGVLRLIAVRGDDVVRATLKP